MKVNVGCGAYPISGFINIDNDPSAYANIYTSVPPLPYDDEEVEEIYAGHFLEHLEPEQAGEFLDECYRCLKPGGKLGIVVPDTREVMRRYVYGLQGRIEFPLGHWNNANDLDDICALFLYSTVQDSPHCWSYDKITLGRLLEKHLFRVTGEINPWMDARIKVGAWYQFGLDSVKV